MYRIILPLPRQRGALFQKSLAREGAGGWARVKFRFRSTCSARPLGSLQYSHFAYAKPRFLRLSSSPVQTPSGPALPGHRLACRLGRRRTVPTGHLRPQRGRQAPSPRGLSTLCVDWGSQNNKAVTEGACRWARPAQPAGSRGPAGDSGGHDHNPPALRATPFQKGAFGTSGGTRGPSPLRLPPPRGSCPGVSRD